MLIVPHTRIFDLSPELALSIDQETWTTDRLAAMLGESTKDEVDLSAVVVPPPQSLSLNVSSSCNLACGYCYADRGAFQGAQSKPMTAETARSAVEKLMDGADRTRPITIGFLGGEPLRNRQLIRSVVDFAATRARQRRLDVRYSITTNGTLIVGSDIDLFRDHAFAVTVSIDGDALSQDVQRPMPNGRGTFALLASRVAPLLANPGVARVAARLTIRTGHFDLQRRLEAVWSLGFPEAGVAPLRTAADGSQLHDDDWSSYCDQLIAVARLELARALIGLPIRLTNFAVALKQIHAGASSPYPCGAGGGYFSLATDGDWYTCHRAIGNEAFRVGSTASLDNDRRRAFLEARHVHALSDCRRCWARYLCSGGCHQEANARSPASCDFIRRWLDFCLASYCELSTTNPAYFAAPEPL